MTDTAKREGRPIEIVSSGMRGTSNAVYNSHRIPKQITVTAILKTVAVNRSSANPAFLFTVFFSPLSLAPA